MKRRIEEDRKKALRVKEAEERADKKEREKLQKSLEKSTSSYSNSSSYHSGGRQTPNTMSNFQPRNGYSRAAEIFRNVEVMRAKKLAAKEKESTSKAR